MNISFKALEYTSNDNFIESEYEYSGSALDGRLVRTSRCGDFRPALRLLAADPGLMSLLERHIITREFPAARLPDAFEASGSKGAIKVTVRHF